MNSENIKKLLFNWGNKLLDLKIESKEKGLNGGLLCPACARVHGRSIDAAYGFMSLYSIAGELKYKDAALDVINWSKNLKYPEGGWGNDLHILEWKGITVFNLIVLLSILKDFKQLLNVEEYASILEDLNSGAEYVYNTFTIKTGNINYPISAVYALNLASKILGNKKYQEKAFSLLQESLEYFNGNMILFGEGYPQNSKSKSGCRPIDICYNVEESLPNLALYALDQNDNNLIKFIEGSYKAHLRFMIDDGGWDNSWCSRMYKWSYWGSRTTDGCQLGLVALANENNSFFDAAERNFKLLVEASKTGLLAGGMGYLQSEENICIHHTICHFKSLAIMHTLFKDKLDKTYDKKLIYDFEEFNPVDTNVTILKKSSWRATFSNYDWVYAAGTTPSGGTLTFLKHDNYGLIFAAGLSRNVLPEAFNMQSYIQNRFESATPRIEVIDLNDILFQSTESLDASIEKIKTKDMFTYVSSGNLCSSLNKEVIGEKYKQIFKILNNNELNIEFYLDQLIEKKGWVVLPFITFPDDEFSYGTNSFQIKRHGIKLILEYPEGVDIEFYKNFNYVPGFNLRTVRLRLINNLNLKLKVI